MGLQETYHDLNDQDSKWSNISGGVSQDLILEPFSLVSLC